MLRFPLDGLLDEQACYEFLLRILHPDGLHCPHGHPLAVGKSGCASATTATAPRSSHCS